MKRPHRVRGLQTVTLCISTAMVLVLVGMVVLSVCVAKNLSDYVRENFVVTLTLDDDMTQPETQRLSTALSKKGYIKRQEFISKEQALQEQTAAMGADPTEFLGANPFLASIEIYLAGDYANSDSLEWIQRELQAMPKIAEITYQRDLMDTVNRNLRNINLVLLVLAVLLACVSFTLINNTVRLRIHAHRFTIHTMKLVGAPWGFIRKPFLMQGLMVGIVAGVSALVILAAGIYALYNYQPNALVVVTPEVMVVTALSVLAFGLLLTWLCTLASVNKLLNMKASQLYE